MDVSPKTLREVEFREKLRGYHPEDVDQFQAQGAADMGAEIRVRVEADSQKGVGTVSEE